MRRLTQEEFISRAQKVWGDRFDLSKAVYVNNRTKVEVICREHGSFFVTPSNFLKGSGCRECGYKENGLKSRMSLDEFIERAQKVHNGKYIYDKVVYVNSRTPVEIICPKHGSFFQIPEVHLRGCECPCCARERLLATPRVTTDEFIQKAKAVHGDEFDYSETFYNGAHKKVKIICRKHGAFYITANSHLNGQKGCLECKKEVVGSLKRLDTDTFIQKATEVHGNEYDYSNVQYVNCTTLVDIICKKHGVFHQIPASHLFGQGCPTCRASKGEKSLRKYLEEKGIEYVAQKKFDDCYYINKLPFDFYLPKENICIEYQGEQHYFPVNIYGGDEGFKERQRNDKIKRDFCDKNNIKLIEIKYTENIEDVLNNCLF